MKGYKSKKSRYEQADPRIKHETVPDKSGHWRLRVRPPFLSFVDDSRGLGLVLSFGAVYLASESSFMPLPCRLGRVCGWRKKIKGFEGEMVSVRPLFQTLLAGGKAEVEEQGK